VAQVLRTGAGMSTPRADTISHNLHDRYPLLITFHVFILFQLIVIKWIENVLN
jgi:hypothetical protein